MLSPQSSPLILKVCSWESWSYPSGLAPVPGLLGCQGTLVPLHLLDLEVDFLHCEERQHRLALTHGEHTCRSGAELGSVCSIHRGGRLWSSVPRGTLKRILYVYVPHALISTFTSWVTLCSEPGNREIYMGDLGSHKFPFTDLWQAFKKGKKKKKSRHMWAMWGSLSVWHHELHWLSRVWGCVIIVRVTHQLSVVGDTHP